MRRNLRKKENAMLQSSARLWQPAIVLGVLTLLSAASTSRAGIAYITGGITIYQWDTTANTVTPIVNSANGAGLDSLTFDTHGNIVYSIIGSNSLGVFNPNT